MVDKNLTPRDVCDALGADWHVAHRFLNADWVAEEKLDRFLCAMGCEHLWHFPPLDEIYQELNRRAA